MLNYWHSLCVLFLLKTSSAADDDYNTLHRDGSYEFGYENPDSYHHSQANRNNVVRGEFGGRNPATGGIDSTIYTAGPRGFRPRGKNVHRKYDLNQSGPRPVGSRDDPYYDPFEDPSYSFGFRTRTYTRQENANRVGDVTGKYSYLDDVGERHNVDFIAGAKTGFHVRTPYPDSNPRAYGPLYFRGRGRPIPRGRTSIQRGLDGSYRFISAGPDQRRTETSDATGHVRGSYTYLDDKGVQHSVHYIAGPETGYRVLKNVKGPHLPTIFPFGRPDIIPADFYDYIKDTDIFDAAASGGTTGGDVPDKKKPTVRPPLSNGIDVGKEDFDKFESDLKPNRPSYQDDGSDDYGDIFGGGSTSKPGLYKPPEDDGQYRPGPDESGLGAGRPKPQRPRPGLAESKPSDQSPFDLGGSDSGLDDSERPSPGLGTSERPRPGLADSERPRPGLGTSDRPRPGLADSERPRPGLGDSERPRPGLAGSRPTTSRPSFGLDDYDDDDLNLFGSESNARPPRPPSPGVIQVGGSDCDNCQGTIVTNVGDRHFNVPPGVSVRAHVQSIDLLPVVSKVPSPSQQYKQETSVKTEQLNAGSSEIISRDTTESDEDDVTVTSQPTTERTSSTTEKPK